MNRVSITNLALSNLGEAPIQNLTDDNARARIANARIDDVIRGILRMHDWNSSAAGPGAAAAAQAQRGVGAGGGGRGVRGTDWQSVLQFKRNILNI